ncbi:hypothetical protein C5E02_13380 [Rathayibacter rathayi]|uniref:AraC family transcriptional regulator n=1 Tax=Rathayibacter rathayi TaxID=33887 RepID=A0ABX5AEV0_RATRA|nr:hypothetical protein [Rathayibacter rathayi]AZZ50108.1 hypothetical protein C1O28_13690 [Rathayibacter rathayi]MWV74610.1 hypothetical protein [Rathayibacter rathayi NCPPB 2980 = VKM Ac-1601]PPF49744.1 hypothetical protein C5C08_06760 [Rathayibacter rathayi]PPG67359.1 hypothetical protein C5C16_09495 [Rathayibacter rathayi]PPG76470.1 hypothetical protein C5C15_11020 [Rathayibacter rathayi]
MSAGTAVIDALFTAVTSGVDLMHDEFSGRIITTHTELASSLTVKESRIPREVHSLEGREAHGWFDSWGARIVPSGPLAIRTEVFDAPGMTLIRIWHTAAQIIPTSDSRSTALLPLGGQLRVLTEDGRQIGDLTRGQLGLAGKDASYSLHASAPVSWMGVKMAGRVGAGAVADRETVVLRDPDQLPLVAVSMINSLFAHPEALDSASLAHLRTALLEVLGSAAVSARHHQVQ